MALLFLGNSYTFYNDLNLVVEGLLDATTERGAATTRLADGGLAFSDHVARVETHAEWDEALVSGSTAWSWGVLQDQSQIPGFYGEDPIWEQSAEAAAVLDGWLQAKGAETLLLLTWGRRDGDSSNPTLYPDFPTMQAELTEGYVAYRDALATEDRPVWIAPAGLAWAAVYDAMEDPTDPASLFYRLYDRDGSHPSPTGTWLAACTLYSAITGESAEGQPPLAGVDADEGAWLAGVAWQVVTDGEGGLSYPWQGGGSDTGAGETGAGETGEEDSAGTGEDTASDTASDTNVLPDGEDTVDGAAKTAGCGCAVSATQSWPAAALLGLPGVLALLRRRQRT